MEESVIKYDTPSQPRQIRLDTTTACNAKCPTCHRYLTARKGNMTREFISQILDDVASWENPLEEIIPVNYGEFFIRTDWYEIMDEIALKLPKTKVVVPTNGSLITPEAVEHLCYIPGMKVINFSINAYFDRTYRFFMGFEPAVIDNIRKMILRIKTLRPDILIWVSMVGDPRYHTDLERDLFYQYWAPLVTTCWIITATSAGRSDNQPDYPVPIPCRSIYDALVIGYDGKLSSCCFDAGFQLNIGLYSGDAKKDWMNDKLVELRRKHNNGTRTDYDLCSRCSFA